MSKNFPYGEVRFPNKKAFVAVPRTAKQSLGVIIAQLMLILYLCAFAVSSSLAVSLHQTFPDLVAKSETIFVGTVSDIQNEWDSERSIPFTYVTFSDVDLVKGGTPSDSKIILQFYGGPSPDGYIYALSETPEFTFGEKVVIFSAGNNRDAIPLVGISQGVRRVSQDTDKGIEVVSRESSEGVLYGFSDASGTMAKRSQKTTDTTPGPLPLSTFLDQIREELAGPHE